jgi:Fur family iron response transcriptional regulator
MAHADSIPRHVAERLSRAGLRPTRQRLSLAGLLFAEGDRHVSAEGLHAEASRAGVPVSLATVYNTLHQFTTAGLLREVVVEAGRSYFDTNVDPHHHFFHERTGELRDIHDAEVTVSALPTAPEGTRIARVDVVIRLNDER